MTIVGVGVQDRLPGPTPQQIQLDQLLDLLHSQKFPDRGVALLLRHCQRVADKLSQNDLPHGPQVIVGAEAREFFRRAMPELALPASGTVHALLNRYCGLPPDCTLLYEHSNGSVLKIVRIRTSAREKGE